MISVRSKCPACSGNLYRVEHGRVVFGVECTCGWKDTVLRGHKAEQEHDAVVPERDGNAA